MTDGLKFFSRMLGPFRLKPWKLEITLYFLAPTDAP